MNHLPSILAQEDSNLPKYIFALIFFVIWALSAFVSWMNKRQQEAKRQQVRQELERASRYGRTPSPVRQQPPQQRQPVPPAPKQQQRRRVPKPAPRRAVPVLPALSLEEVAPLAQPYVNITQPVARPKPPTVDAGAVKKWLKPATLRQQFILTEILQPPLVMRPDRHDRA